MDSQICMTHQTVRAAWFTEKMKEIYDRYLVPVNPKRGISWYPEICTVICVLSTDLPRQLHGGSMQRILKQKEKENSLTENSHRCSGRRGIFIMLHANTPVQSKN